MALVYVTISLFLLAVCAAFTIDLGLTYHEQRRIEFAADAAAQAAAALLIPGTTFNDDDVEAEAYLVAAANNVEAAEVQSVECGVWQAGTFVACGSCGNGNQDNTNDTNGNGHGNGNGNGGGGGGGSCSSVCSECNNGATAVRVTTNRAVPTVFAPVMGITSFNPVESAVAASNALENCVRPFGIWEDLLTGLVAGDTVKVSNQSPGNWGKLDICHQMSSGSAFLDAMLNGVCCNETTIGDDVETGTGFGGSISHVFDDVINAGKQNGMIFEVNSQFNNGNSIVGIRNFIKVNLVSNHGNGKNWSVELEIVEYPTTPPTGTGSSGATLVK